eukprot:COSAG01_NODE_4406_length_5056_cov_124.577365_6_plen_164_part_00
MADEEPVLCIHAAIGSSDPRRLPAGHRCHREQHLGAQCAGALPRTRRLWRLWVVRGVRHSSRAQLTKQRPAQLTKQRPTQLTHALCSATESQAGGRSRAAPRLLHVVPHVKILRGRRSEIAALSVPRGTGFRHLSVGQRPWRCLSGAVHRGSPVPVVLSVPPP